jgi:hypothetical protein
MTRKVRGEVVPVYARYDQTVEVHWRDEEGNLFVQRMTIPPKAVRLHKEEVSE